jgi:hypothetical protein
VSTNDLGDCLKALAAHRVGTLIHVGATASDLDDLAKVPADRLVLVQGDPDAAAELGTAASGGPGNATVVKAAVAAEDRPLEWRSYNLRSLNGPIDMGSLQTYYPRLTLLQSRPVQPRAFGALVEQLTLAEGQSHALVLDVPGQEDALVAALTSDALRRFEWIALRGCREIADPKASHFDRSVERLVGSFFRRVTDSQGDDSLWPCALFRFDREACLGAQIQALQSRVDKDAVEHRDASATIARLQQENDDHRRLLADKDEYLTALQARLTEVESQARTASVRVNQLQQENDRQRQQLAGAEATLADRDERLAALQARLADIESQARAASASAEERLRESLARIEQLQQENGQMSLRQRLLDEELAKTEGQIEVLKDVLLREPGL